MDRLVGKDGKARKRPRRRTLMQNPQGEDEDDDADLRPRKRRKDEWDEWAGGAEKRAKMMHAVDIIGMGADPNSEKVQKLIREAAVFTFKSPPGTYDPLAGRSEDEALEWHVFMLFLARDGGEPQGVARYVEWVLQRPFQNVTEWLGEEGDKWRKTQSMSPMRDAVKESWRTFLAEQSSKSQADIIAELETLEREWASKVGRWS